MTIKITSCNDSLMWYYQFIGFKFTVIFQDLTEYLVRTPSGTTNIVKINDADIVK